METESNVDITSGVQKGVASYIALHFEFSQYILALMPITHSAEKALRVSKRKRVFNLRQGKQMKDALKEIKKMIGEKKGSEALSILPKAYKMIDKAAKGGIIKKNNAARKKSRLARLLKK